MNQSISENSPLLPPIMSSIHKAEFQDEEQRVETTDDPNAEFGGTEARKQMEKKLVRKLDLRMSILIIIYILNYVRDCSDLSLNRIDICFFSD